MNLTMEPSRMPNFSSWPDAFCFFHLKVIYHMTFSQSKQFLYGYLKKEPKTGVGNKNL